MCGIAGAFALGREQGPVSRPAIERMLTAIRGRGPDAQGIWMDPDGWIGLANARLSTMDARPIANQPLLDVDGTAVVTFNGEIYNYQELKQELEQRGYRFRTRSDTEVLLNAYKAYGTDMLPKLQGQFAFALYDLQTRMVLLARDPVGISPLYYLIHDGVLWFASEPRGLLQVPGFTRTLNANAAYHYLVMEATPLGETLFEGIRYLRAGNFIHMHPGSEPREERFADYLFRPSAVRTCSKDELAREIRLLVRDAVARRMVADKEVGLYLSGGVDSSAVLALMREIAPDRTIQAFSVGFEEIETHEVVGELPFARESSRLFGAQQRDIIVRHEDIVRHMARFELPPPSILDVVFDIMAQETVRAGVEVVITGEGSDEMFLGYDHYFAVFGQLAAGYRHFAERFPIRATHAAAKNPKSLTDIFLGGGVDPALEADRQLIFGERVQQTVSARRVVQGYLDELARIHPNAELDKQMLYIELCCKMPELLIRREERPCMGSGL